LPLHPAGLSTLLGKAAAVQHERGVRIAELLRCVPSNFGHHRFVIPLASADEQLDWPTLHARLQRHRFRCLPLQMTETALQHQLGVLPLFFSIKPGKIPFQESRQPPSATPYRASFHLSILQQHLRFFPIEQRHPCPSALLGPSTKAARI
jgi:hypothetical protein